MASIQDLMKYIANMEGFGNGNNPATRNNNPGNLKFVGQVDATGKDQYGFAIFPTVDAGWNALQRQIELDQSRGLSLRDFTYKYAPPTENNTTNYLNYLSSNLGISADSPLSSLNIFVGSDGTSNNDSGSSSGNLASLVDNLDGNGGDLGSLFIPIAIGLGIIGIVSMVRG